MWREGSLRKTVAWTFSDGVRTMEVFSETVSTHERFAICASFQLFCLHNNELWEFPWELIVDQHISARIWYNYFDGNLSIFMQERHVSA